MAKKSKGKQKEEKSAASPTASQPVAESSNGIPLETNNPFPTQPEPEPSQAWGSSEQAWGTQPEPNHAADSWGIGDHQDDQWAPAESLLERPQEFTRTVLPTIPEQSSSGHFTQNRSFSEGGESVDEYSDNWEQPDTQRVVQSPQSGTLTPTAAASVMGTPIPQPTISLAQAAAAAQEQLQRHHKFVHASDAARKHEEEKLLRIQQAAAANNPRNATPSTGPASLPPHPNAPIKFATASAWAAMHEKKLPTPAQPPQPSTSKGKAWQYPQPLFPNSTHQIKSIPADPSWIMTGGNTWSNKHRTTKGEAVPRPHVDDVAWQQQLNHYREAEKFQQGLLDKEHRKGQPPIQQFQQRPQHHKHHSHPGHPMQNRKPAKQSWQGWGKDYRDEEDDDEEDDDDEGTEVPDGWNNEGWDNGAAAGGWDPGAWGPPPTQHQSKRDQGRGREKKHADQRGEWGPAGSETGGGSGWGQNAWEQYGESAQGHEVEWSQQGQQRGQHNNRHGQKHHQKSKSAHHVGQENAWGQNTEAPGGKGDGWGKDAFGWGQDAGAGAWGSSGGEAWGAGGNEWPTTNQQYQGKVSYNAKESEGTRNVVSGQQRSQILNSFVPQSQSVQSHGQKHQSLPVAQKTHKEAKTHQAWEAEDHGWGSIEDEDGEYDGNRRVRFSPKTSDIWGGSPRSVPTKTLAHAQQQQGIITTPLNDASNVRFVESRGAAFAFVSNAFFGNSRFARERVHWMFPSNKDQRVADMLAWVQKMSFNLGTFGLMKFLQTRERGAIFINTVFRMQQYPQDPPIDWLTFNQLQGTMDKILQESVAFYDPARLVIVFVYLPSQSGNSVAIWRKKVNVPDNARLKYQAEVTAITQTLRKDKEYVVLVDELPKPKVPQKGQLRKPIPAHVKSATAKEKRKWWKFFLS